MQATYALEDRRVLGRAPRSGVLDLDPRTIMGVLLAASVVAFMSKSLTVELGLVLGVALLQALTGHVRMALAFAGGYAVLWAVPNLVFPQDVYKRQGEQGLYRDFVNLRREAAGWRLAG